MRLSNRNKKRNGTFLKVVLNFFLDYYLLNFRDCLMEKWNRLKFSEVVLNFFLDYYLLNFRECDSLMEK